MKSVVLLASRSLLIAGFLLGHVNLHGKPAMTTSANTLTKDAVATALQKVSGTTGAFKDKDIAKAIKVLGTGANATLTTDKLEETLGTGGTQGTLLYFAATNNYPESCKALLNLGADLTANQLLVTTTVDNKMGSYDITIKNGLNLNSAITKILNQTIGLFFLPGATKAKKTDPVNARACFYAGDTESESRKEFLTPIMAIFSIFWATMMGQIEKTDPKTALTALLALLNAGAKFPKDAFGGQQQVQEQAQSESLEEQEKAQ